MRLLEAASRAAHRTAALPGARRLAAAAGFGALSGFAYAPLRWPVFLIIALSGLLVLLEGVIDNPRPRRTALLTGTVFGGTFFAVTTAWLANAFLVQADAFGWMIPIVLPLFFAGMGLFYGVAAVIHVAVRRRLALRGLAIALPLLLGLAVTEWLRGHILTGFPWNLHVQAMAGSGVLLQPLAALGPYGYGIVVGFLALLPGAALLVPARAARAGLAFLAVLAAVIAYGGTRLALNPPGARGDAQVIVVQPNVRQRDKLDSTKVLEALRRNLEVSFEAAARFPQGRTSYIVWPENAYPFLDRLDDLPAYLAAELPSDSYLVSGSIRSVENGYANTLLVFGPAGEGGGLIAAYDKHRLVPFGETLPFASLFETLGIESLSPAGGGGFLPGGGPVTLALGAAPFAPLICYEDVFPGGLYPDDERPEWLTVITNDAWFGDAAGPKQHLDIARMRAIESGLPVIRSANTGISAVIDAEGRLLEALPLYEPGVISAALPVARPPTLYVRTGELLAFAMLSLIGALTLRGGLPVNNGTRSFSVL